MLAALVAIAIASFTTLVSLLFLNPSFRQLPPPSLRRRNHHLRRRIAIDSFAFNSIFSTPALSLSPTSLHFISLNLFELTRFIVPSGVVEGMGDNGGTNVGDRPDNKIKIAAGGPSRSPWKTSSAASPVTGDNSDSWPALSDAKKRSKGNGGTDVKASPMPTQAGTDGCDHSPPQSAPVTVDPQKLHGRANIRHPRRPYNTHQNRYGPNHGPNNLPPFPGLIPYHQPISTPVFPRVPISSASFRGFAYPRPIRTFPGADAQLVNSGNDLAQAYMPPMSGNFQPSLHADSNAHDSGSGGRRHSTNERYGELNHSRNNQHPAFNNFYMQQNVGMPPLMWTPYFSAAGFVDGPHYPGAIHYYPVPQSYQPVAVPYSSSLRVSIPPTIARKAIVMQIEYYFSDENLQNDVYLISLMNSQGWVSISNIAEFRRVKKLNVDIPFILDALKASETVEVQGDEVRRRKEWSKWIPASLRSESASTVGNSVNNDQNETESTPSHGCTLDFLSMDPDTKNNFNNNSSDQNMDGEEHRGGLGNNSRTELGHFTISERHVTRESQ